MQDRHHQIIELSCDARPDHTFGSDSTKLIVSTTGLLMLDKLT
jgi:hypothetical protein